MERQWQLLGEVPDSDDEDFDGQQALGDSHDADAGSLATEDNSRQPKRSQSVSLVVLISPRQMQRSQTNQSRTTTPSRPSSPSLASLPLSSSDDEIDLVHDGAQEAEMAYAFKCIDSPRAAVVDDAIPGEAPPGHPDIFPNKTPNEPPKDAPTPQGSRRSQKAKLSLASPAPAPTELPEQPSVETPANDVFPLSLSPFSPLSTLSRSPSPLADTPALQLPGSRSPSLPRMFPELSASPPAFRLGFVRSLRPRKPIQQHPYLLEGAQYAQAMKSHGVKPVRTEYSAPKKHVVEEDSQEQEFQDEDSQQPRQSRQLSPDILGDSFYDFPGSSASLGNGILSSSFSLRTSTPAHRLLPPSSQTDGDGGTNITSPSDHNDVPRLETVDPHRRNRKHGRVTKPASSLKTPSAAKRARILDGPLREATPPRAKWIPVRIDSSPDPLPRSAARVRPDRSQHPRPEPSASFRRTDSIVIDDNSSATDGEGVATTRQSSKSPPNDVAGDSGSESGSEVVRVNSRRIKGVLPASWLRLDQQKTAQSTADKQAAAQRRLGQQNDQAPRRGVALPRQTQGIGSFAALAPIFDESSDDDNDTGRDRVPHSIQPAKHRLENPPLDTAGEEDVVVYQVIDDEDIGSVMEAEIIDRMEPGSKRRSSRSIFDGPRPKKQKTRQPKITGLFERSGGPKATEHGASRKPSSSRRHPTSGKTHNKRAPKRPSTPPLLSILDFVDSAAPTPDFIRIAARTARSKPRLGKASPSRKVINLGSRNDNVDALSVLHDWRAGKIKPRVPNPPRRPTGDQAPLKDLSPNLTRLPSTASSTKSAPSRSAQTSPPTSSNGPPKSFTNRVVQRLPRPPHRPVTLAVNRATRMDAMMRPAQLETIVMDKRGSAGFVAKKRNLDEMYRRRRKSAAVLPNVRLEQFIDDQASTRGSGDADVDDNGFKYVRRGPEKETQPQSERGTDHTTPGTAKGQPRARFRKSYNPQPIDTSAPRFVHALDPMPVGISPDAAISTSTVVDLEAGKLQGLGPFGSQYSQHFDVFPVDSGVYFHHSTLLGSGHLKRIFENSPAGSTQPAGPPNPTLSFQLDERTLRWSAWDDVSSSEYGILMDWLADALFSPSQMSTPLGPKVHTLVNFVLDFIESTVVLPTTRGDSKKAFVLRNLEVVTSFADRFSAAGVQQAAAHGIDIGSNNHQAALTGLVAVAAWLLRICGNTPECLPLRYQVEDMLSKLAKASVRVLLKQDLSKVRTFYGEFHRLQFRDRGIRRDMQALCSWVVLMQVLEHAKIPRSGFWDVTYSIMLSGKVVETCTHAGEMERLWEDMFTLLPLCEFDDAGQISPGLRHILPVDGWELPRKALDRVFQLYKANSLQSPSFNAYCRSILGRCHYLIQEWGWRNCKSVIGTVFDFYGSQDFEHLRNEEVYKSPHFLEELARSPSLAIDAEDKCFHIFIKMLALVILQLRKLGLTKEMTNLVSRVLPNHDRQYLKEKEVHQRDLAALRNHHDLLCTLFWAASPEVRPPLHQIENLVMPANSHKEACLINIRAWNQLARFVIASDEGYGPYKGFSAWMKNIFQQMLEQYLSVESDLHKQFQNLSKNMMQGIGPDMLKAMAAANQAAAMDVLQACMVSSLDVLRHAKALDVATYCFSTDQLEAVFAKMDLPSPKTSWSILGTALDMVDHYMDRVDKAMDEQYSSLPEATNPGDADDAVLMLDHKVARGFFRLTYTITHMSWEGLPQVASTLRVSCTERCVVLAARVASRFIHSGVYSLSRFFGTGDYCLFERLPHTPGLWQRKFVPLFVSAVIESNVFDFKDLGNSILELWMLSIVKPQRFLAYETQLAKVLQQHDLPYVRRASVPAHGQAPNYDTNRAFFACAMTSMRQQLRDTDGAPRRQQLRADFARALKLVMQQMKGDLRYAKTEPAEHAKYIGFVQGVVALIRSHGGDICTLDKFFYDQSVEYSPSPEDPQLRTASIVTYGLRLGEGEATAAPQLFHYLHNNFSIALAHDELDQECRILERSMANNTVLGFMLERMLPAILRAARETEAAWPLLHVYCSAVERFVTRAYVPKDIGDENVTGGVVGLLEAIQAWLHWAALAVARQQRGSVPAGHPDHPDHPDRAGASAAGGTRPALVACVRVHAMAQLAALASVLQPFLMTCLYLPCAPATHVRLERAIAGFCAFARSALADLDPPRKRPLRGMEADGGVDGYVDGQRETWFPTALLRGDAAVEDAVSADQVQISLFSRQIVQHVRNNWVVGDGCITVRSKAGSGGSTGGGGRPGAAASAGVPFGPWTADELLGELQRQLRLWRLKPAEAYGMQQGGGQLFPGRERKYTV